MSISDLTDAYCFVGDRLGQLPRESLAECARRQPLSFERGHNQAVRAIINAEPGEKSWGGIITAARALGWSPAN